MQADRAPPLVDVNETEREELNQVLSDWTAFLKNHFRPCT